jgi:hypothetical protein
MTRTLTYRGREWRETYFVGGVPGLKSGDYAVRFRETPGCTMFEVTSTPTGVTCLCTSNLFEAFDWAAKRTPPSLEERVEVLEDWAKRQDARRAEEPNLYERWSRRWVDGLLP